MSTLSAISAAHQSVKLRAPGALLSTPREASASATNSTARSPVSAASPIPALRQGASVRFSSEFVTVPLLPRRETAA